MKSRKEPRSSGFPKWEQQHWEILLENQSPDSEREAQDTNWTQETNMKSPWNIPWIDTRKKLEFFQQFLHFSSKRILSISCIGWLESLHPTQSQVNTFERWNSTYYVQGKNACACYNANKIMRVQKKWKFLLNFLHYFVTTSLAGTIRVELEIVFRFYSFRLF